MTTTPPPHDRASSGAWLAAGLGSIGLAVLAGAMTSGGAGGATLVWAAVAVYATAADGDRRYDEVALRGPAALVVGREGAGLSAAVQQRATARLRIPLAAPVESLNVGVAAALVLFEASRQRGFR